MAAFDVVGNPSSVHGEGRAARAAHRSRRAKRRRPGRRDGRNVIFTSGGTEANVLALTPPSSTARTPDARAAAACRRSSIRRCARAADSGRIRSRSSGDGRRASSTCRAARAWLAALATRKNGMLVWVMLANNETGVISRSRDCRLVHEAGGHCCMSTRCRRGQDSLRYRGARRGFLLDLRRTSSAGRRASAR